jgi:beta-galactosidase
MRGLSYQAVARGASGVLFFQWRASRAGAEKFHSAMVSHSGQASPIWCEVTTLGQEFDRAEPLDDAVVSARAGMVFSWPNWWAVESPAGPAHDFSIQDHLAWMYLPLYRRCVTLDFCHPQEALESYEALVVPSLYLVTEAEASNLVEYVERGGTVVMSYWSGIVDEHDQVYLGPYGGPLRPLMGCDVLEVAPLASGDVVDVEWADGGRTTASYWLDLAVPSDGEVLATVVSGPWAGTPAVVRARCGAGSAYYIGTRLDADGLQRVYDMIPALRGERAGGGEDQVDGVERVTRRSPGRDYEFLVNHSDGERKVQLDAPGYDLLGDRPVDGTLELEQRGVAIVRRDTAPPDGA